MTATVDSPASSPGSLKRVARAVWEAVDDAWYRAELAHARSWQAEVGLSASGGCERRAGYQLHGVAKTNTPPPSRSAILGTWIHDRLLPLLAEAFDAAVVEQEVTTDGVRGHLDLATSDYGGIVVDVKTGTESSPSKLRQNGPRRTWLWQTHEYAKARIEAGHSVAWIAIVVVDRAMGDTAVWVGRYDPDIADQASAWWHGIRHATDPDLLPRGGRGPGLDPVCDSCPWLDRCWGVKGQRAVLDEAADRDEVLEGLLALYRDAAERERRAKDDKDWAKACLEDVKAGRYGSWELRWRSTGKRLDQQAARAMLVEAGLQPPLTEPSYYPVIRQAEPEP